ncbi:MAG: GFA family protein [Pseudomonadota bacterium]
MQITGRCFCGDIEYTAQLLEANVGICHCRDCQIFSGSAFRTTGVVAPADFQFTRGEPKVFDKRADSGATRRMAFCGNCGTHLCSLPDQNDAGAFVSIRVATCDQFDQLTPQLEVFCASKVSWLPALEDAVRFNGMPGDD